MAVVDIFPALFDNYFIKVIFLIHATLVSMIVIAAQSNAVKMSIMSYNAMFLIAIMLAVLVDKNIDILLLATSYSAICMALDVMFLIFGAYPGLTATLLIVIHLVFRPVSTILLLKNYSARAGVEDPTSGLLEVSVRPTTSQPRSAYQNIDEPNQTLP